MRFVTNSHFIIQAALLTSWNLTTEEKNKMQTSIITDTATHKITQKRNDFFIYSKNKRIKKGLCKTKK